VLCNSNSSGGTHLVDTSTMPAQAVPNWPGYTSNIAAGTASFAYIGTKFVSFGGLLNSSSYCAQFV
jgi:Fe2+ transport system protein B